MYSIRRSIAICGAICILTGSALKPLSAQENASGWPDYQAGDFKSAMEKSASDNTADGYALACRSAIVLGGFQRKGPEAVELLHQGISYCEQALKIEPTHLIGKMSYAMGVAYEGKRKTSISLAKTALRLLEETRDMYPAFPEAHAAVAGWHSEVRAAGFLARVALSPSKKAAKSGFAKAAELGMKELPLMLEYLKYLARQKKRWPEALALITVIEEAPAKDGFDVIVKNFIPKIKAALVKGDKNDIRQALKEATAFRGIKRVKGYDTPDMPYADISRRGE